MRILKAIFVTFGDGSPDFRDAAIRLGRQAELFKIFQEVVVLNKPLLQDLSALAKGRLKTYKDLTPDSKYLWSTKSIILSEFVSGRLGSDCDLLFYADAGCEMRANILSRGNLKAMLAKAYRSDGYVESTGLLEKHWTKRETLGHFPSELWNTEQLQATWFVVRRSERVGELAQRWEEMSHPTRGLWQDPLPGEDVQPELIEHRYDQSLFSLTWKSLGMPFARQKVNWLEINFRGSLRSYHRPILAIRNRTGKSQLRQHPFLDQFFGY